MCCGTPYGIISAKQNIVEVDLGLTWGSNEAGHMPRTISYSRVIDLSHVIEPGMPLWPGDPPVEFETVAEVAQHGYYLRRFSMGEHSATHMNAPSSFRRGGPGIDAYSAESLVAPALVVDIRDKTAADPDYALTRADVLEREGRHGQVRAGSVVLLYTGWQEKWKDPAAYLNPDASGNLHFPGFGTGAARFLLAERGIAGLGIDTHGVDGGPDTTFGINAQVLAQDRILAQGIECPECPRVVLENLTNLDQLPPTGATLVIGVLRLRGGSGSPVSVMAFVP